MVALRSSQSLCGGRFLGEGANAADDVARTMAVGDDPQGGLPGFFQLLVREPAHAGTGVIDHGAERLRDFMGNGGGELAHDREPRHMGELRLGVVQSFLGPFALGDVHSRPGEFGFP
jgi:hypothetical protein